MAPMNLVELVKGLLPIALAALALGHLNEVRNWAAHEAFGRTAVLSGSVF